MSQTNSGSSILDQETGLGDAVDQPGIDYPFTQDEIDELLYGETSGTGERLAKLRELRDHISARREAETFGNDPQSLLDNIEAAIQRLEPAAGDWREDDTYALDETMLVTEPLDHRETLSPDDDELLDAMDEEAASLDQDEEDEQKADESDVLDESEWSGDNDGFRPERGVQ